MAFSSVVQALDPDVVWLLVEQHFVFELVEALKDGGAGFPVLVAACAGVSGGDEATISVLFGEVSTALDAPGELDAVLDSAEGPAVALAGRVRARHDVWRASRCRSIVTLARADRWTVTRPWRHGSCGGGRSG
ncbi:hypothetical protein ALI144C_23475 [Actinosynnema sp. ALI-1.44]|uniref:hypothetical protein n=1 Tax=Actinosynnema sp. ALI-1.44 TaxID=1933779 RepID=UPI00097BB3BC|nr:hypothetical protein [Actinosynnema sp. ALI-1.44]ONI79720.1 hypothetical protein ALI144C_23475 [Actinosynnema sp. ALI-1.44]